MDPLAHTATLLAHALEEPVDFALKAVRELVASGVPREWLLAEISKIDPATGSGIGVWAWKKSALDRYRSDQPAKPSEIPWPQPDSNGATLRRIASEKVASATLEAEFKASGFATRREWYASRAAQPPAAPQSHAAP